MNLTFSFFLRLFIAFVAAKLILGHLEADTPAYLLGLTLLLVANTYLFDLLEYWHREGWRRQARGGAAALKEAPKTAPETPSH